MEWKYIGYVDESCGRGAAPTAHPDPFRKWNGSEVIFRLASEEHGKYRMVCGYVARSEAWILVPSPLTTFHSAWTYIGFVDTSCRRAATP